MNDKKKDRIQERENTIIEAIRDHSVFRIDSTIEELISKEEYIEFIEMADTTSRLTNEEIQFEQAKYIPLKYNNSYEQSNKYKSGRSGFSYR